MVDQKNFRCMWNFICCFGSKLLDIILEKPHEPTLSVSLTFSHYIKNGRLVLVYVDYIIIGLKGWFHMNASLWENGWNDKKDLLDFGRSFPISKNRY